MGDFVERTIFAWKQNLKFLQNSNINYKIIIVDFNPIKNFLFENFLINKNLKDKNINYLIIPKECIEETKTHPKVFYEYFAKNAAARHFDSDIFIMTNSDIVFSKKIIKRIEEISKNDNLKKFNFRIRFRKNYDFINNKTEELYDPSLGPIFWPLKILNKENEIDFQINLFEEYENIYKNLKKDFTEVEGSFAGDFTLFFKKNFIDIATGYNEGTNIHKTDLRQGNMDAEILYNLHMNGIMTKFINEEYVHLKHEMPRKDGFLFETYKNSKNWGYSNCKKNKIQENVFCLSPM